jgi:hypothetical protein
MTSYAKLNPKGGEKVARIFLFLLAAFAMATLVVVAKQQQVVAVVVNLRGEWYLNSSRKLGPGSSLTAGGRIEARDPKSGDYIEIADRSGRIIINRSCDSRGCGGPIILPADSPSLASRLYGAAMALLAKAQPRFVVLISRGGELREAVVKIAGEQVDLSSVLANKGKGTYLVRFEPKGEGITNLDPIGPVVVEWDPSKLAVVTVKGLKPGLYQVQPLNNEDREPLEPGTEAWVLFARPDRFDQAFCEFREVSALTKEWGRSIRESSKRQFLRAALGQLDAEGK